MKVVFNIICNSRSENIWLDRITSFVEFSKGKLLSDFNEMYWKENKCSNLHAEIQIQETNIKRIIDAIENIFSNNQECIYEESNGCIDIGVFSSIQDILESDKIFLTAFIDTAK